MTLYKDIGKHKLSWWILERLQFPIWHTQNWVHETTDPIIHNESGYFQIIFDESFRKYSLEMKIIINPFDH